MFVADDDEPLRDNCCVFYVLFIYMLLLFIKVFVNDLFFMSLNLLDAYQNRTLVQQMDIHLNDTCDRGSPVAPTMQRMQIT